MHPKLGRSRYSCMGITEANRCNEDTPLRGVV